MSELIHIWWEGPYSLDEVREMKNAARDYGVYQVYGTHALYGSGVLLYIGKAQEQTFAVRISQETWTENRDARNVQIYVGRLYRSSHEERPDLGGWSRQINDAEKLLIYAHGPVFNTCNKNTVPESVVDLHVFNWGQYRMLLPEVSGFRYVRWRNCTDESPCYEMTLSEMKENRPVT